MKIIQIMLPSVGNVIIPGKLIWTHFLLIETISIANNIDSIMHTIIDWIGGFAFGESIGLLVSKEYVVGGVFLLLSIFSPSLFSYLYKTFKKIWIFLLAFTPAEQAKRHEAIAEQEKIHEYAWVREKAQQRKERAFAKGKLKAKEDGQPILGSLKSTYDRHYIQLKGAEGRADIPQDDEVRERENLSRLFSLQNFLRPELKSYYVEVIKFLNDNNEFILDKRHSQLIIEEINESPDSATTLKTVLEALDKIIEDLS